MNYLSKVTEIAKKFEMDITLGECSQATLGEVQAKNNVGSVAIKDATLNTTAMPVLSATGASTTALYSLPTQTCLMQVPANFQHLIAKWPYRQQSCKPKDGIALAEKDSFSPAFDNALGRANTTNVYGLNYDLIKVAFFEALLEREASRQFTSDSNADLLALLNITESQGRDRMTVFGNLGPNNELKWILNYGNATGTTWTRLISVVFNLSRMDALATLANILSMNIDNLSKLSSDGHAAELLGGSQLVEDVPNTLHLPGLPAGSACAELMEKKYTYGNAGQIIGAILRYRLNGNDFCLPATVGRGVLCMGKYKPTAHFLNQHLMDQHPFAQVIFFQDMRTALAFESILEETRGYTHEKFIVTAHIGDNLSVLPWNYFHGHEVVFIPAPTKECMGLVKLYKDYIAGVQAKSFRIYSGFLLHSQPGCDLTGHVEGVTDAEAELLHTAIALDGVERPLGLIQKIISDSVSYNEFVAWGQRLGIFKAPKETRVQTSVTSTFALPPADPALSPAPAHSLADVTLHHSLRPGNYVMLLGAKGAGKTQIALSTCRSILKGNAIWPLFRSTGIYADNVAYVDAETPYDEYCANLVQHGLANEQGQRFFGLSTFAPDLPEFCNAFSLADSSFREGLFQYLLEHRCRFVFLDNLTALMGDGVHQGKAAQDVLGWVEKLQKHDLCVVLVHHKSEYEASAPHGDKARGSQLFTIRARAVIALMSRAEIMDKNLGTETVRATAVRDGLTVGIRFNASKAAPVLEKKTFWLHLPLGDSQWEFLAATGADGKEIEFAQVCAKPETGLAIQDDPLIDAPESGEVAILGQLSSDEKAVYDMAQTAGNVKTADIVQKLNCCDRKARNLTKILEERGLLEPNGRNGSQQGYRVKN